MTSFQLKRAEKKTVRSVHAICPCEQVKPYLLVMDGKSFAMQIP